MRAASSCDPASAVAHAFDGVVRPRFGGVLAALRRRARFG
jgi:hypothetical protein